MHTYTIEWNGVIYSGTRPTREAAMRARVEKILALRASKPKRPRAVAVRAA